jgi:serine/threonine protein kinase
MIGRAVSHYRVLSTLGSGGMGVVYLAEDERLGRQVALKFLPAESVTNRQALERFRVEARAASSLSHPGICAIFDIGDDGGTPYIVMEALKGESLRDRINRGPMKVTDLLEIGIQLADALDAAHAQGIIHRDIKPSNIFVGDKNRTKILDFGLAKLAQAAAPFSSGPTSRVLDASTHRELTLPGSALGTVSYMSPEQARGEELDTRSDLFSLGVVLYEMSTGIQAFGGSTQAIVFDAILNRTPQPVSHINPVIPPRLESVIATALEKERELRYQHASDLEAELKRIRRDLESSSLVAASRTVIVPAAERTPVPPSASTSAAPSRRSWMWPAIGALTVLALAIAGFNLWSDTATPDSETAAPPASSEPPPATASAPSPTPVEPSIAAPPPVPPPAPAPEPRRQEPALPSGRSAQQPQPNRPAPSEPRPQAVPTPVTPSPQRPQVEAAPPATTVAPTPVTPAPVTPAPAPQQSPEPATAGAVTTPAPAPSPAAPAVQPPVQTPPRATATAPTVPPASPVESDDAAVRGVIRTYERALETKNVDLFRSVRPGLSAAEETRLRDSFRQVDSHQIDIVVDELRVEGRTATVRLSRRDTIVNGGRRQTQQSRQTLRLEKTTAGWIISDIAGR